MLSGINIFLVIPFLLLRSYLLQVREWYYYSGAVFKGGQYIKVDITEAGIPVFIKSNSLQSRGNIYSGNSAIWSKENKYIDFYYYPGEGSTSMDFEDDGKEQLVRITATLKNHSCNFLRRKCKNFSSGEARCTIG